MGIMILASRGSLNYDDHISKYIPEFSRSAHLSKITLRQLLTHTSGIPDYGDLGIGDDSTMDQKGLIDALLQREDKMLPSGQAYRYSNPGYSLLGIVIERISGKSFSDFMTKYIFAPLGMKNTFVYDAPNRKPVRAATGYDQFGNLDNDAPTSKPGDGGIYSTVDDLLKWDQALYTNKLVPQATLVIAYTPGSVQLGKTTYGYGWNIAGDRSDKYVWHTGAQAGYRAYIERHLKSKIAIIMLTNKGNSKRIEISKAIANILRGQPYALPKRSGAEAMYKAIHESGIKTALQLFDAAKSDPSSGYDVGESELNTLGYQLLYGDKRVRDAIEIFKLNTAEHPTSSNAFDSLGEAYLRDGQRELALESYQTAIKLDPRNGHAASVLTQLK
jgi:CubicO group peptidase (beta-lactamase class C family)